MKSLIAIILFLAAFGSIDVQAQSMAQSLGLYAFPANDQSKETQEADESACFSWAKQQTGIDPLNLPEPEVAPQETGPDGTAVRSAAKGAAMGAAIGAIAGDAGEGAAIGATAGGFGGLAQRRAKGASQAQQAEASAQQQQAGAMNTFKKAFSACLEGKGYTVK